MNKKKEQTATPKEVNLSISTLDFEEVVEPLLAISPVKQDDLKDASKPKKRSEPKTK